MSLQITKNQNEITLKGNLIASNIFQMRNYCLTVLGQHKSVKVNLSGLDQLDVSAAIMFRDLKHKAYNMNKGFFVTNGQNEKIAGAFRMLDHQVLQAAA